MTAELRRASRSDLPAVAALMASDPNLPDLALLETFWTRAHHRAWVDDEVSAYGEIVVEAGFADSFGYVRPDRRGRGVGSALLGRLIAEAGDATFRHGISPEPDAEALMAAAGLVRARSFRHMGIDLPAPPRALPAGLGVDVADDRAVVHRIIDTAFRGHWDFRPQTFEAWMADRTGAPGFDPSLWLLARMDDEPVGAVTCEMVGEEGWVLELGVLPGARGHGVGGALLHSAFAALAARGVRRAALNVDSANATGALALYERAGMTVFRAYDVYERAP